MRTPAALAIAAVLAAGSAWAQSSDDTMSDDAMAEESMADDTMMDDAMMMGAKYAVTVTNTMAEELLAPILITNAGNDGHIFDGHYVTPEAEEQILTGDPGKLAMRIGEDAMVGHGSDGPPGVLLAPGKSVTFEITTDATAVRVLSMVAPTMKPDNYFSAVVDLHGGAGASAELDRFDIGHDEGTMVTMPVSMGGAKIEFTKL